MLVMPPTQVQGRQWKDQLLFIYMVWSKSFHTKLISNNNI
jgi:hypothetical protein